MKKISLSIVLIIGLLLCCIPAASAEVLTDDGSNSATFDLQSWGATNPSIIEAFRIYRIQDWDGLYFLYCKVNNVGANAVSVLTANPSYDRDVNLKIGDVVVGSGTAHYNALYNNAGTVTGVQCWLDIDNWHPTGYTGFQYVRIVPSSGTPFNGLKLGGASNSNVAPNYPIGFVSGSYLVGGIHLVRSHYYWENVVDISDEFVSLTRHLDGNVYVSTLQLTSDAGYFADTSPNNIDVPYIGTGTWEVINPYGKVFTGSLEGVAGSDSNTVTIYVRNTQTHALIANAHINISASVNGTLHEVVNETVPSGIYSIDLQPTGGGMPNPDFYRLIVTAEGYNSIMPYIDFEVDGATTIYAYLDPVGGAPENENNTFIDFFVRDMSANPISGATVNFGGYTLITNSAGYTIFEVDKSKTYSWTVSKSGYGSLTGNAVIGSDTRHTINTVIAPAVTPTTPTSIPTSTPISPTPTMTAPTGEPVSNWLEWFAAHFGMILGGGAEIGKIFMWLCFSVPVGVYVGKEAKAGAAGFMAGAGIVTLFFVLIGWVPIWIVVLLALIIGLLYAKVFNNSDNGGGR